MIVSVISNVSDLQYLLGVVGLAPSLKTVSDWSAPQRFEAANWAVATHLRASDNDVDVPTRPGFLPEPWRGPDLNTGDVFGGPQATVF